MDWLWISSSWRARAFIAGMLPALALGAFLTVGPVWRAYAWLPQSALRSDRLRITHELASRWLNDIPEVLILGGSQAREVFPDGVWVSRELSRVCGRPIGVLVAASSSQPIETSWAIVDHFRVRAPELTVLAPNLLRDATDRTVVRRLARSRFLIPDAVSMKVGPTWQPLTAGESLKGRLGIVFADVVTAAGIRPELAHPADDPFDSRQHNYTVPVLDALSKRVEARYAEAQAWRLTDAALQGDVAAYQRVASRIHERGGEVLLMLTPVSPASFAPWSRVDQRFADARAQLAASEEFLDLRMAADLTDEDFFDDVHLVRSGREKLWPSLRDSLVAHLRGCAPAPRP